MLSTRRQFLHLAAAAFAARGVVPARAAARDPRPFGFSLYGMKTLPLAEAIDHLARIGYRQVELALLPGFPSDPAQFSAASRRAVRDQIRARGLTLSSLMINISLVGDERARAAALETIRIAGALAHEMGGSTPPVLETVMGGKPEAWDAVRASMAERLRDWGTAAESAGVTLCVKAHAAQAVNSPERLQWIVGQAARPGLALAYDYSHFQVAGLALEPSLRALLPQTRFVHLKDVAVGEKAIRFLLPGEGTIDYRTYFQLLDTLGYAGPAIVEVSTQIFSRPGYDPVRAAEQSFAVFQRALAG